ncbi:MAG: glutamate-5-semialdehyde dehydrogenase [Bacteroidales bacterium]|nr:glutamate-5-semialdehyde dehydrogenase [Candidatus Physcousia equi]
MKQRRIAVKIGSNVLTRKDGTLDATRMSALVDQVAELRARGIEVVMVSSGAVASGRSEQPLNEQLDEVSQRQLFSAIGQAKLINRYYELFREHHIRVGQVLTMKESFSDEEHCRNQQNCMEVMLAHGVIPIVNENDTVAITELMFTDNDELSGLVAQMLHADTLILLSNIDGIYDAPPSQAGAQVIRTVLPGEDLSQYISTEKSGHGRGGMTSKYHTASLVAQNGIEVVIANGKTPDILLKLIDDPDTVCTRFVPAALQQSTAATNGVQSETEVIEKEAEVTEKKTEVTEKLLRARVAANELLLASEEAINKVLCDVAEQIKRHSSELLAANAADLQRMNPDNPLYDRLRLDNDRLNAIANDTRNVATLRSPLGHVQKQSTLPNALQLKRVSVPFGVVGVIFEARPNVAFDVAALCLKSGNACVLKGGRDAEESCRAIVALIRSVLEQNGLPADAVTLLPASHEATAEMLQAVGLIDLVIPRGSSRLIRFVRDTARVPVIETGAGICHCYVDSTADLTKATAIVQNAKTRRVSVCNALDCLLIHRSRLSDLPSLAQPLGEKKVLIYADTEAYAALQDHYPTDLLLPATDESFGTEFLSMTMSIGTVDSLDEALRHIALHGSHHSESIVTEDPQSAERFLTLVDAACVYHNAPTSFTDGAQFGLGAEIGISTQKLHARGPMALEELTTYKWQIRGNGQVRK